MPGLFVATEGHLQEEEPQGVAAEMKETKGTSKEMLQAKEARELTGSVYASTATFWQ